MEENDFFREFTLRICGSFDLKEALWRCLLYVRSALPADELILTVFDPAFGFLEVVTTADEKGGVDRGDKITMGTDMRKQLEHVEQYPRVRISNDALQDPIMERLALQYRWSDSSLIVGRLVIQHNFVGSLIVRANGKDRYTEGHARLWSLVNEPTAIALANSRKYYELLKMKDLLADDNRYLQNELRRGLGDTIVGADFGLRQVFEQVVKVAPLTSPVLLTGETGTGKEVIANAIHSLSLRNSGPLITVNCGAIPESLVDSELFGHEKGSFTGALTERRGRFERAHRGTIFLDEVGELPPQAQVRLLRVLQEKEIERVGGTNPIKVDIRIISATHRSLEKLVAEGSFRDDLYYRLGVFPIHIPPLRERKADIPALVEHFIEKKRREMGLRMAPTLSPGAIDRLMQYAWPGNVREVANVVERALIQSDGKPLTFTDLIPSQTTAEPGRSEQSSSLRLEEMEALHIRRVLEMTHGRIEGKNGAALLLGVNPSTLRARMRRLHIPFGRKKNS
ncbi:MAG TPA: sigma 54-interacting transcriptional regulator [Syntrophorhabdales bacterium]|nr:sigma 54-interacting transcriptional regulator [Syntrophorhabdales bacterium]